jgi:hypothetical protein
MPELSYSEQVRRQGDLMHKMMRRVNVDSAFASSVDGGLAWYQARTKNASSVQACHNAANGSQHQSRREVRAVSAPMQNFFKTAIRRSCAAADACPQIEPSVDSLYAHQPSLPRPPSARYGQRHAAGCGDPKLCLTRGPSKIG